MVRRTSIRQSRSCLHLLLVLRVAIQIYIGITDGLSPLLLSYYLWRHVPSISASPTACQAHVWRRASTLFFLLFLTAVSVCPDNRSTRHPVYSLGYSTSLFPWLQHQPTNTHYTYALLRTTRTHAYGSHKSTLCLVRQHLGARCWYSLRSVHISYEYL